MHNLLVLGPVGLGDRQTDAGCVFCWLAVREHDALHVMEAGSQRSDFLCKSILLCVVPFGGRLEGKRTAQRLKPFGFRQVIVHQTEAEGPQFRFCDAKNDPLGASRQSCSELLEGTRQVLESRPKLLAQAFLKERVRGSQLVQSCLQSLNEGLGDLAARRVRGEWFKAAGFGEVREKQPRRFTSLQNDVADGQG